MRPTYADQNKLRPVFGVTDQVRHKQGFTATQDDERLEILDYESTGIVLLHEAKQGADKPLFFFFLQKSSFSHDAAQFLSSNSFFLFFIECCLSGVILLSTGMCIQRRHWAVWAFAQSCKCLSLCTLTRNP